MSTPVIESIAQNVLAAISDITVANGYNQTLTATRPTRIGYSLDNPPNDLDAYIRQNDPTKDDNSPLGVIDWTQPFQVDVFVIDSDSATTPIDTRLNAVIADIQKKIIADPTRGGLAINTTLDEPGLFYDADTRWAGVIVEFTVRYRVNDTDPYTQA